MDGNYAGLRRTISNSDPRKQSGNTFYIGGRRVCFDDTDAPVGTQSRGPLSQHQAFSSSRDRTGSSHSSSSMMYDWQAYDPAFPLDEPETITPQGTGRSQSYETGPGYSQQVDSAYHGGTFREGSNRSYNPSTRRNELDEYDGNSAHSALMIPNQREPNTVGSFSQRIRITLDDDPSATQYSEARNLADTGFRQKSFHNANPPNPVVMDRSGHYEQSMRRSGFNPSPPVRPEPFEVEHQFGVEERSKLQLLHKLEKTLLSYREKRKGNKLNSLENCSTVALPQMGQVRSEEYQSTRSPVGKHHAEKVAAVPAEPESCKIVGYENGVPRAVFRRKVTHVDGEIGFAGSDVFFQMRKVKGEILPWVGSMVYVLAEKVQSLPFEWNAISVEVDEEGPRKADEMDELVTFRSMNPSPPLIDTRPLKSILKNKPPPPPIISKLRRKSSPDEPVVIFEASRHRSPSPKVSSTSSHSKKRRRSMERSDEPTARRRDISPKIMNPDKSPDRVSRNEGRRRSRSRSRSPPYLVTSDRRVESRTHSRRERPESNYRTRRSRSDSSREHPRSQSPSPVRKRRSRRSRSRSSSPSRRRTRQYSRSRSRTPSRSRRRTRSRSRTRSPYRQKHSRSRSISGSRNRTPPRIQETYVTKPISTKEKILPKEKPVEKLQAKVIPVRLSGSKPQKNASVTKQGLPKLPFIGKKPKPKPKTQAPAYKLIEEKTKAIDAASEAKKAALTAEVLKQAQERISKAKESLQAALNKNVVTQNTPVSVVQPTLPNPLFTTRHGNPQSTLYPPVISPYAQPIHYNNPRNYGPRPPMQYNYTNQFAANTSYPPYQQQYSYGPEQNFQYGPTPSGLDESMNKFTQGSHPQKILRSTLGPFPSSKSSTPSNSKSNLLVNPLHKVAKISKDCELQPPGTEKSSEKRESSSSRTVSVKNASSTATHAKSQLNPNAKESRIVSENKKSNVVIAEASGVEVIDLDDEVLVEKDSHVPLNSNDESDKEKCAIFIKSGSSIFEDPEDYIPVERKSETVQLSVPPKTGADTGNDVGDIVMDPSEAVGLGCHPEKADLARRWMVCTRCANDGHLISMCDKDRTRRALPFDISQAKSRLAARKQEIQLRLTADPLGDRIIEVLPNELKNDSTTVGGSNKSLTPSISEVTNRSIKAQKEQGRALGSASEDKKIGQSINDGVSGKPSKVPGEGKPKAVKFVGKHSRSQKPMTKRKAKNSMGQAAKISELVNARRSAARNTAKLAALKSARRKSEVGRLHFDNEPVTRISRRRSNSPIRISMITDDPMKEVAVKQLEIQSLELRELEIQQEMKLLKVMGGLPLRDHSPRRSPLLYPREMSPLADDSFCYACLSRGHKGRYCKIPWPAWLVNRKRTKNGYVVLKREKQEPFCLACGETGHYTRNCSLKDPGQFYSDDE